MSQPARVIPFCVAGSASLTSWCTWNRVPARCEGKIEGVIDFEALQVAPQLFDAIGLAPDAIEIQGSLDVWRGPFAIDDVAVSAVVAATAAASQLLARRNGAQPHPVVVDTRHAAASFQTDALVEPIGWTIPPVWDPIAGDYQARDGWIRLHTNYSHHRQAALRALGRDPSAAIDAGEVAALVAVRSADELETAVVAEGGVAGRQRGPDAWQAHAGGQAVARESLLDVVHHESLAHESLGAAELPFSGIRVLDLTRVLAGPVATGFLAAWGADVLRLDPPDFEEVPAIVPVLTSGKRTAFIDLACESGRETFRSLVREADVVVHGYRSDALAALGLDPQDWHADHPGLVEVSLNAYGHSGPWSARRGFDSIVQHSVGITAVGQAALGSDRPVPLPCQALDYGTGWLLAAAVGAGLDERERSGRGSTWRASLARYAQLVLQLRNDVDPHRPSPTIGSLEPYLTTATTAWGPLRRLRWPGLIGPLAPRTGRSGPLGASTPNFAART